ncbi:MAG: dioxygenase [Thermoguttaceae bacterium]|jgi:enamine deaminase RidA (YjgF/YER057c/UK114 family)
MIRKESNAGVGYSVVELGGVRHVFVAAAARRGTTIYEQAEDALGTIERLIKKEIAPGSIVMQSVFLRDLADQAACREIMRDFYGKEMPATTYIPQPPCEGKLLAIEALGVGRGQGEVEIVRKGQHTVIARHDGITWVHVADIHCGKEAGSVYDRTISAFRLADQRLAAAGFGFEEVVRTWLYLGDITAMEGQAQRYRELNRARTDFYRNLKFIPGLTPPGWARQVFPASTGIGAEGKDVTISCMAMRSDRPGAVLVPLENPAQTSAYDYAHQYGSESPKFCRAMAVAVGDFATTFISGTASITSSETRHLDDVRGQTLQTLDNIEGLIAADNFRNHGLAGFGATLGDLALARVYLKRHEDYAPARTICKARLGELPTIYAVGDICRPELLVEIEGIAFCRRQG